MSGPSPAPAHWKSLAGPAKASILTLAGLAAILGWLLWPSWSTDPDVSHGLFMPVAFAFLIDRSRSAGPWRFHDGGPLASVATAILALGALGLLVLAGLYATAIDWSNALVSFILATALSLFLLAAVVVLSDRRVRWVPLNWIVFVAAILWPLASPIPPGTYTRLTIGLQLFVTRCVIHALHTLGVVAIRHGNVIQLANTAVGVEEACSGIRSLVSCVFVGIFLSAGILGRPRGRALIILLSAPLALGMNFIRSLTLTLLAESGVDIEGRWHDVTGFAVLLVTAAILAGLALYLSRHRDGEVSRPSQRPAQPQPTRLPGRFGSLQILVTSLFFATVLVAVFYFDTRPASPGTDKGGPDMSSIIPGAQPGWSVTTSTDIYEFRGLLRTDNLAQRIFKREGPGAPTEIIIYAAYWRPGQAPVSLVETHTPDACWPGSGWVALPLGRTQETLEVSGRAIVPAEARRFGTGDAVQNVWYWHLYAGQPVRHIDPYSLGRLLKIAWNYGFRRDGSQLFLRISSNRAWPEIAGEPAMRELFNHLQPLGL